MEWCESSIANLDKLSPIGSPGSMEYHASCATGFGLSGYNDLFKCRNRKWNPKLECLERKLLSPIETDKHKTGGQWAQYITSQILFMIISPWLPKVRNNFFHQVFHFLPKIVDFKVALIYIWIFYNSIIVIWCILVRIMMHLHKLITWFFIYTHRFRRINSWSDRYHHNTWSYHVYPHIPLNGIKAA